MFVFFATSARTRVISAYLCVSVLFRFFFKCVISVSYTHLQTRDKDAVSPEQMQKLCENLKEEEFDYIIIDCPAGIEQGFKNAIAGADRALVVTTPEVSAVRDADRIIGLLEANELTSPSLILNRVRPDMVDRGDMMSIDAVSYTHLN